MTVRDGWTPMLVPTSAPVSALYDAERASIRLFVERHRDKLATGLVLDYGSGAPGLCVKPSPYRSLIDGEYAAYDPALEGAEAVNPLMRVPRQRYDAILCTQVLQYASSPGALLLQFHELLHKGGALVLTYPTHWPEVETWDCWRFTGHGMEQLVRAAEFEVVVHEARWRMVGDGFTLTGGYGLVAVAR